MRSEAFSTYVASSTYRLSMTYSIPNNRRPRAGDVDHLHLSRSPHSESGSCFVGHSYGMMTASLPASSHLARPLAIFKGKQHRMAILSCAAVQIGQPPCLPPRMS
jgi:hypothetical protein